MRKPNTSRPSAAFASRRCQGYGDATTPGALFRYCRSPWSGLRFLILKRFHGLQLVLGPYIALKRGARYLLDFWERALHRLKEEKSEQSFPKLSLPRKLQARGAQLVRPSGRVRAWACNFKAFTTVLISLHKVSFVHEADTRLGFQACGFGLLDAAGRMFGHCNARRA